MVIYFLLLQSTGALEVFTDVTTTTGSLLRGDTGTTVTFTCTDCLLYGDISLSGDITINGGNIYSGGSLEANNAFINPSINLTTTGLWNVFAATFAGSAEAIITIFGNFTSSLSWSVNTINHLTINSYVTVPNAILEPLSSIRQSSDSVLDCTVITINSPDIVMHGAIKSIQFVELNGLFDGSSLQLLGSVSTDDSIFLMNFDSAEFGGSVHAKAISIDSLFDLVLSGVINLTNSTAVTMDYANISITPTATITTPISLTINSSSLSVFGSLQVPILNLRGHGGVTTLGFTTSAASPVISASGSIYMTSSMDLTTTLLDITSLGSTTFGGNINTTGLNHSISGDVTIDGTLQVGANVSFVSSTNGFSISPTGHLIAPNAILGGSAVSIDGKVDTTSLAITATTLSVGGNGASIIKASTMALNSTTFSLGSSSSVSVDGAETINVPSADVLCPGGR